MLKIDTMMTDMVHIQDDVSVTGEFYGGMIFGVLIASFLWYFILSDHKFTKSNKLTFRLWL